MKKLFLVYNCYDVAAAVEADARASAAIMSESDYYNIFATAYEICAGSGSCTTCLKGN